MLVKIDDLASALYLSRKENFKKWDIWHDPVWSGPIATSSYEEEIAYLKNWLIQRIIWIDNNVDQLMPGAAQDGRSG